MVPSLSWGAQPNRPHHNIRRGATRRCLSASFPTSPPIRLRRRPLNSPWLSLVGQGSACKAPCTLCIFLEAVHNVLSASGPILQRVLAQCHAVHDCGKPGLCHKFATLSLQKPAIQSKTAHHTAKCNALFLLGILGGAEARQQRRIVCPHPAHGIAPSQVIEYKEIFQRQAHWLQWSNYSAIGLQTPKNRLTCAPHSAMGGDSIKPHAGSQDARFLPHRSDPRRPRVRFHF